MWPVYERKGYQMYRLENKPLDFTPHQNEEYNHIKKQYVKHLLTMVGGIKYEYDVWTAGGIVSEELAKYMGLNLIMDRPKTPYVNTMFVFDVIETEKNPDIYLNQIKEYCHSYTQVFITCPCRTIMSFWSYNHWHEIDPLRFKHLVEGCGFKIVQHKDKIIWKKWHQYIGFRGILRLLFGHYHLHIYELRLK